MRVVGLFVFCFIIAVAASFAIDLFRNPHSAAEPPGVTPRSADPEVFDPRTVIDHPFPAIIDAPMVSAEEIGEGVSEQELVIGVVVDNSARAYPVNMLTGPQREIVNDTLGGKAIAATW